MLSLTDRILQKTTVDYRNVSIVSNPDGVLAREDVRTLLFQLHGIEVVTGNNLKLHAHFEQIYKTHPDRKFIYITDAVNEVPQDMRSEAFVCDFKIADAFPLFAYKALLQDQSFEVLCELYKQTCNKRVTFAEAQTVVSNIAEEFERKNKQSAEYCIEQLLRLNPDWRNRKTTIEAVSEAVVNAIKNGVYPQIASAIETINSSFQNWIDEEYFAALHSNHLLHPKSVNKILPHLADNHDQNDKVALLVVDGFAYWQYVVLRNYLQHNAIKTNDNCTLSWLPSITMLSRQAIFKGKDPQQDYKQNPENERKLWNSFWQQRGFSQFEIKYLSDKDDFIINSGVKRLAFVTVEMDEKMHSSTDNKDLLSLTENWCPRITEKIRIILDAGFKIYLTTDHGSVLSHGCRPLTQTESIFLYKDGSRGKRHLIYNNAEAQQEFAEQNDELSLLQHENWITIRDDSCFARKNDTFITHGGSHFMEVVIPFVKIEKS